MGNIGAVKLSGTNWIDLDQQTIKHNDKTLTLTLMAGSTYLIEPKFASGIFIYVGEPTDIPNDMEAHTCKKEDKVAVTLQEGQTIFVKNNNFLSGDNYIAISM